MFYLKEHSKRVSELGSEYFKRYVRWNIGNPVKPELISMDLLCGDERKCCLKTRTKGDASFVLRYRKDEGSVLSLVVDRENDELSVVQLQGAKDQGFRVTSGIHIVELFGDQVLTMAACKQSNFRRLTMPLLKDIEGLYESQSEAAIKRYEELTKITRMKFSGEENKYIRELRDTRSFAVGSIQD